jgi:23S rRNA (cytosine1962-C5)-methyltransferase
VSSNEYSLIDAGHGRRLERFGPRIVDRPAPAVAGIPARMPRAAWATADLVFDREDGWTPSSAGAWTIQIEGLNLELRPTAAGQVGLFPEHSLAWPWLRERLASSPGAEVLHLFGYSGATTLALAAAGARVTHVDASRPAVAWARRNAELSGLADRPMRWIVEDALTYVRREERRGRRYGGIVLDPPSFGHGPGGARWELDAALPELLAACEGIATADAFVLLSAHTPELGPDEMASSLENAFGIPAELESADVELVADSGAVLPLGTVARMIRR